MIFSLRRSFLVKDIQFLLLELLHTVSSVEIRNISQQKNVQLQLCISLQLIGLSILGIGVWAWTEKNTFHNLSLMTNITLDPAFIFIWAGAITFVIGFTGYVLYTQYFL